jgi:hypothetical protein
MKPELVVAKISAKLTGRYRKTFAFLQLKPPNHVPVERWRQAARRDCEKV